MKYLDYKERRTQGSFSFPVAYYRENPSAPRYEMQYHWHTYYEILHIVSGSFHLTLNDQTRECLGGDTVFIRDGVLHGGKPENCVYECVVFDLQFFTQKMHGTDRTVQGILDHSITVDPFLSERSPRINPLIEELCAVLAQRKEGYELTTQGLLYVLLGTVIGEHLYEMNPEPIADKERLKAVKDVLTYIAENYSQDITLEKMASVACMNPKYFCRYFRHLTERTPVDYLNYYRIECACEMLSTKDISIRDAAISCGYNDDSYFIKVFRKYKGITPRKYLQRVFR